MSHVHVSAGEDRVRAQPSQRAERAPAAVAAAGASSGVLRLQRVHGNRHVARLLAAARDAEGEEGDARHEGEIDLEQAIEHARGSGRPLDALPRRRMEAAFGADFGGVRVHTGRAADALNRALGANAFTLGRDIFFRAGSHDTGSSAGTRLLAHELTHVVQQQPSAGARGAIEIGDPGDRFEREAERVADIVGRADTRASVEHRGEVAPRIQRQGEVALAAVLGGQIGLAAGGLPGALVGTAGGALVGAMIPAHATVPQHVRAASTPTTMAQDRIPPRVDTSVFVGVFGLSPLATPVTFSVENQSGPNGTVTIDGAATSDRRVPGFLRLRGATQTAPGNGGNLQLVAKQGTTELARSGGFSVSSIPQNWSVSFVSLITADPAKRGIKVTNSWESDSGNVADLDQAKRSETVEVTSASGCFNNAPSNQSGYKNAHTGSIGDTHSSGAAGLTSVGTRVAQQAFKFRDDRTGAVDIPATRSGFLITRVVTARASVGGVAGSALWLAGQTVQSLLGARGGFFLTVTKTGHGGTANGITTDAASGTASGTQVV